MKLVNWKFEEMANIIKQKKSKIYIFGAGMIGTVTTIEILKAYELLDSVAYFVDNSKAKWETNVDAYGKTIPIENPDKLKTVSDKNDIVILTTSRFTACLEQLDSYSNLKDNICLLMPMLCIENFPPVKENEIVRSYPEMKIPKVIHYMWLGGKKLPDKLQSCVDSWKKYCPDYEIICWNENNYDIDKHPYMRQAYENKMYGFVPDYARLDLLYEHGGIYLDTDVELVKGLDDMLYQDAFCCVEKWQTINFGGGSGAIKGSLAVKALLDARSKLDFVDKNGNIDKNTCGFYDTRVMLDNGYRINGRIQKVLDMNVYPYEFFHSYDYMTGRKMVTDNTIGIHHFNGGWLDEAMIQANKNAMKEYDKINNIAKKNSLA